MQTAKQEKYNEEEKKTHEEDETLILMAIHYSSIRLFDPCCYCPLSAFDPHSAVWRITTKAEEALKLIYPRHFHAVRAKSRLRLDVQQPDLDGLEACVNFIRTCQ